MTECTKLANSLQVEPTLYKLYNAASYKQSRNNGAYFNRGEP